ncbi:MAG: hypothetical protein U0Q16_18305 [Bryobacteraceae bacterium]
MSWICQQARTPEEMDEVFRLRYLCYHAKGAIATRADRRFHDAYDELPNQFSFLLRGEDTTGSVRISVVRPELGWHEAPSATVFGDHPAFQRIAACGFVEASRLCFLPEARRDVLYRLVANLVALADYHGAPWVVACPREEHARFYTRIFGFHLLGEPRPYYGVNFRTALLAVPLEEIHQTAERIRSMRDSWSEALQAIAATAGCAVPRLAAA